MRTVKSKKFISALLVLVMILTLLPTTMAFAASYETIGDFVKNLYVAGLGRQPDVDGYLYWVNELENDRPAAEVIGHVLLESDEFKEKYADISKEEFVKKAYEIVFGREADEEGLKFWVDEMRRGASQRYVIVAMLYAPTGEFQEFCKKVGIRLGSLRVPRDEYPGDEFIDERKVIEKVAVINNEVEVEFGTSLKDVIAKLVKEVKVEGVVKGQENVELIIDEWTAVGEYDGETSGDYTFEAELIAPEGYKFAENVNTTIKATVKVLEEEFRVKNVTAINAKIIAVDFTKPVQYTSVVKKDTSDGNYVNFVFTINEGKFGPGYDNDNSTIIEDPKITADGKTVIFELKDAYKLDNGDRFGVDVKNGVLSLDGERVEAYGDTQKEFNDEKAPEILDAKLVDEQLVIYYNEPIDNSHEDFGVNVDGVAVADKNNSGTTQIVYIQDEDDKPIITGIDYTLTISLSGYDQLLKEGTHEVIIYNMRDIVDRNGNKGNREIIDKIEYVVGKEAEEEDLEVTGIEAVDFNSLKVSFNAVPETAKITVYSGKTVYYDKTHKKGDTNCPTSKNMQINLPYTVLSDTDGLTCLYDEDATTTQVRVVVEDYKGSNKVVGEKVERTLTLKREAGRPVAKGDKYNKVNASTDQFGNVSSEIKFEIPLTKGKDTRDSIEFTENGKEKVRVKDASGAERIIQDLKIETSGNDKILSFKIPKSADEGVMQKLKDMNPFTVIVEKGALKVGSDLIDVGSPKKADGGNWTEGEPTNELVNDKFVTVAKHEEAAEETEDDTRFKYVEAVDRVDSLKDSKGAPENIIEITFKQSMNATTVTNVDNYKLDGKALPEGTRITIDASGKLAQIILPEGSIAKDCEARLMISTDVETANGAKLVGNINTKEPYITSENLKLADNVRPVVVEATFLLDDASDKTSERIELVFSEEIEIQSSSGSSSFENALEFFAKNSSTPIAATGVEIKADANGKNTIVVITLEEEVNVAQGGTLKLVEDVNEDDLLTDTSSRKNKLAKDTVVNVKGGKVEK